MIKDLSPPTQSLLMFYFCELCGRKHKLNSKIGVSHAEYAIPLEIPPSVKRFRENGETFFAHYLELYPPVNPTSIIEHFVPFSYLAQQKGVYHTIKEDHTVRVGFYGELVDAFYDASFVEIRERFCLLHIIHPRGCALEETLREEGILRGLELQHFCVYEIKKRNVKEVSAIVQGLCKRFGIRLEPVISFKGVPIIAVVK